MKPFEKLKEIRDKKLRLTQEEFAEKFGLKLNTVRFIEQGRTVIPDEIALDFESEYGIPFKWWKTGQGSMTLSEPCLIMGDNDYVRLPLLEVSCGNGHAQSEEQEFLIDKKHLMKLGFKTFDKLVVCRAIGDSMQPEIKEGDLLIINTQFELRDSRIYVINAYGDLFCKKIRRGIKYFIMESINEKYPEETFNRDEMSAINVVGQVITTIREMRI